MTSKQVSRYHRGTAESLCTAKKWFGHGAGRSPCAHSIGKFFLCYILFFLLKLPPPARPGTTCIYCSQDMSKLNQTNQHPPFFQKKKARASMFGFQCLPKWVGFHEEVMIKGDKMHETKKQHWNHHWFWFGSFNCNCKTHETPFFFCIDRFGLVRFGVPKQTHPKPKVAISGVFCCMKKRREMVNNNPIPIASRCGIFTYIYHKNQPNCREIYHTWIVWLWDCKKGPLFERRRFQRHQLWRKGCRVSKTVLFLEGFNNPMVTWKNSLNDLNVFLSKNLAKW